MAGRFGPNYFQQVVPDLFTVVFLDQAHLDVVRSRPVSARVSYVAPDFVAPNVGVNEGLGCPYLGAAGHDIPPRIGQVGPVDGAYSVVVPVSPDPDVRFIGDFGLIAQPLTGLNRMSAGHKSGQRPKQPSYCHDLLPHDGELLEKSPGPAEVILSDSLLD